MCFLGTLLLFLTALQGKRKGRETYLQVKTVLEVQRWENS